MVERPIEESTSEDAEDFAVQFPAFNMGTRSVLRGWELLWVKLGSKKGDRPIMRQVYVRKKKRVPRGQENILGKERVLGNRDSGEYLVQRTTEG